MRIGIVALFTFLFAVFVALLMNARRAEVFAATAAYAAVLALVFLGLSGWVMAARLQTDTLHGTGGNPMVEKRMRSQGNFAEYVPYALLLMALLEAAGGNHVLIQVLGIVLLVGRLLHPIGMLAAKNSPPQFACRGGGILATFAVIAIAAIALLVRIA